MHSTTNLKQITNSLSAEETHLKHLINSSDCKRVGQSWRKPEGQRFSGDRQAVHLDLLLKFFTPWDWFGMIWDLGFGDNLQTSWPGSLTPRGLARILGEVPSDLGKGINNSTPWYIKKQTLLLSIEDWTLPRSTSKTFWWAQRPWWGQDHGSSSSLSKARTLIHPCAKSSQLLKIHF